jgi:hypothetical protein
MEKHDSTGELSYHKVQRSAEIAVGMNGYMGHLSKMEIDRRMVNYQAIMDEYEAKEVKRL